MHNLLLFALTVTSGLLLLRSLARSWSLERKDVSMLFLAVLCVFIAGTYAEGMTQFLLTLLLGHTSS